MNRAPDSINLPTSTRWVPLPSTSRDVPSGPLPRPPWLDHAMHGDAIAFINASTTSIKA